MEETSRTRKDQERERRRLRDRERRQSMSQEERERHLARRRRNYQLRRQRAEMARLDSQIQSITGNQDSSFTSSPDSSVPSDTQNVTCDSGNKSVEIPLHELAKLTGSIRLTRVKHLARTLSGEGSSSSMEGNRADKTRCALSRGLRLSRFKRLARSSLSSSNTN